MKKSRKIILYLVGLLLILAYGFRIHYVNVHADLHGVELYKKGDVVAFEKTYFDFPKTQISDGYTIKVLDAKITDTESYLKELGLSVDEYLQAQTNTSYPTYENDRLILLTVEIENINNTESGYDSTFWRLQGDYSVSQIDERLYFLANPDVQATRRLRIKPGTKEVEYLPFAFYEHAWTQKQRDHLDKEKLYFVIGNYPVSKRIAIWE